MATSMTKHYSVVLTPDVEWGGYTVSVPDLPGCFTHGDTVDEAMSEVREAIAVYLELANGIAGVTVDRDDVIMASVTVAAA